MYRRFQNRFGTAGVVVAVIALIAALSGTALAASGALSGKQKKEVEKIAKKYAGKPGAPGAAGTNGTNGKDGTNGTNGSPGAAGKDGTGATVASFTGSKGTCTKGQGGLEVKSASGTSFVCNGEAGEPGESPLAEPFAGNAEPAGNPCKGAGGFKYTVESIPSIVCNGKEGSPWTAGGTLPPGATETGVWSAVGEGANLFTGSGVEIVAPMSFSVKLAEPIPASHAHWANDPGFTSLCLGGASDPKAKPGELCVYEGITENVATPLILTPDLSSEGAGRAGADIVFDVSEKTGLAFGSYAVTGCSEVVGAEFPCPAP